MANLNKVLLIGRLTRDPESQTFSNGGKVAKFGFAVNNRKKNTQSGEWEDVPVFIDVEAFNRQTGRQLADVVLQYLHKGNQVFLEGHLQLDQWTQDGQKRSKLKIVLDNLEFLEPRSDGANNPEGGGGNRSYRSNPGPAPRSNAPASRNNNSSYGEPSDGGMEPPSEPMGDPDNIPF